MRLYSVNIVLFVVFLFMDENDFSFCHFRRLNSIAVFYSMIARCFVIIDVYNDCDREREYKLSSHVIKIA